MHHLFTPTYKDQRVVFWGDLLSLLFIVVLGRYFFEENSRRFYFFIWPSLTMLVLYLFGRYSKISVITTPIKIASIVSSVIISVLLSYPFMSGSDTGRIQFSLFLFGTTAVLFSFVLEAQKMLARQRRQGIFFFTEDAEKYRSRIDEINQKLICQQQKIIIVKSLNEIDNYKSKPLFYIVDEQVLSKEKIALTLLERRIQGDYIVQFVDCYADITGRIPLELVSSRWLLAHTSSYSQNPLVLRITRMTDIILGSIFVLVFFLPILFIAVIIKLDSNGPVLFKQERLGQKKHPFILYKFRSMYVDAEAEGPQWAKKSDSRVTRVGSFLRKNHLDELPQLINLLKGDITFVGPRPIRKFFADKLAEEIPYYDLRFLVKPGITGWAQVKGPYGSNIEEQNEKFEMDLYYILRLNILANFFIKIGTLKTICKGQGL